MQKSSVVAAALAAVFSVCHPVQADPAAGVGVSYIFGEGFAAGVKVFSDDQEDEFVGYLGVDYVFGSRQVRPNAGVAYLFEDAFLGGDIGWDLSAQGVNFGLSGGWADTAPEPATTSAAGVGSGGGSGGDGDGGDFEIDCGTPAECDSLLD